MKSMKSIAAETILMASILGGMGYAGQTSRREFYSQEVPASFKQMPKLSKKQKAKLRKETTPK